LIYSESEVGLAIVVFNVAFKVAFNVAFIVAFIVAFNVAFVVALSCVQDMLKSLFEKTSTIFAQTTTCKGITALFRRALNVPTSMRK